MKLLLLWLAVVHIAMVAGKAIWPDEIYRSEKLNDRPVIAVLAQAESLTSNKSYIAASYVKYLESSGARVVPIPNHMSQISVVALFDSVNGVLFPGGSADLNSSLYSENAILFYSLAVDANKKGDYFPIWGTCLGFQTLHFLAAGLDDSVITPHTSVDVGMCLDFTEKARKSRMLQSMQEDLYNSLAHEKITYNHHRSGISPEAYKRVEVLGSFFDILSTNVGTDGKTFVSMVEAKNYPFYGTQWHPEKNNFEFIIKEELNIPHSISAVRASQYMSNFFVNEARKNKHKFRNTEEEQSSLIYNFEPVYTGKQGPKQFQNFEQIYEFNWP